MEQDLGAGFLDHGVATPVSNHRGTVATVDGNGRNVVLAWLFDHRGGYALLMLDAETGDSEEFPMPFPSGGDGPFASILSSANKFYTHFNSHFTEFDPVARAFTFVHETAPQMAMGMTEDDDGRIWSVTYPSSGVVSFDPTTRAFRDYGHVYDQNWRQYQRHVAADDAGWLYFGIGQTASQIIALERDSGRTVPVLPESERVTGSACVYRDMNGKVYGIADAEQAEGWYELYEGVATKIGTLESRQPKAIITGAQSLFHRDFPDGQRLERCDLTERTLEVHDPATGAPREVPFDYSSEGAHIVGVTVAPNDTVCGGTAFPMRFFGYDPATDTWERHAAHGQWNAAMRQGDTFFIGAYTNGMLMEWKPSRPWVPTQPAQPASNPRFLTDCEPSINRPHVLLALADGKQVVLAGTPGYGRTGGGLLFWDRETETGTILEHTDILPAHATLSMVELSGDRVLGGSTVRAGTGGERLADTAELYVIDVASKRVVWHGAAIPHAREYIDLGPGPDGLVFGLASLELPNPRRFADDVTFFVFDPDRREVVHVRETADAFGPVALQQGPRKLLRAPDGRSYVLFRDNIAEVDPRTFALSMVAPAPVPIEIGGDILGGRIYFGSGSHLCSYEIGG